MNNVTIRRTIACLCLGGFLLVLALVVTGHTAGFDDPIRQAFYDLRTERLTRVLIPVTNLANKYFLILLCLLLLILPKTRLSFGVPLSAGALASVLVNSCIKHLVCRPRPEVQHLVAEHGFSFPSGHSISSVVFYGLAIWLVWHYRSKNAVLLTVLLLIPLIMVGLTRIYLGVHYPTDVLGGWCLGGFLVCVSIEVIEAIGRRKEQGDRQNHHS